MINKRPPIVNAIAEINISMLEILLDDNKTYQGATKVVFLERLEEIFEKFKNQKLHLISI